MTAPVPSGGHDWQHGEMLRIIQDAGQAGLTVRTVCLRLESGNAAVRRETVHHWLRADEKKGLVRRGTRNVWTRVMTEPVLSGPTVLSGCAGCGHLVFRGPAGGPWLSLPSPEQLVLTAPDAARCPARADGGQHQGPVIR